MNDVRTEKAVATHVSEGSGLQRPSASPVTAGGEIGSVSDDAEAVPAANNVGAPAEQRSLATHELFDSVRRRECYDRSLAAFHRELGSSLRLVDTYMRTFCKPDLWVRQALRTAIERLQDVADAIFDFDSRAAAFALRNISFPDPTPNPFRSSEEDALVMWLRADSLTLLTRIASGDRPLDTSGATFASELVQCELDRIEYDLRRLYAERRADFEVAWQKRREALKPATSSAEGTGPIGGRCCGSDEDSAAQAECRQRKSTLAEPSAQTAGQGDAPPQGFLGGSSLAESLNIHPERRIAFFGRLARSRISLGDENWCETSNPRPNRPRYLYRTDSPRLQMLATLYTKSKSA